ncbi:hypothetical protein HNP84_000934 [Thermocatellispora tengchongensis]|uniref:5-bromo-4-chloroindolyl phosphate hydrolysis protein n=1 Tax=Thermocatellispora tengchongensis TaxID=1073253 RepID=A0A840NUJ5_9ACTN|nr:hypothetical protein [Thermocatellispora tengchongensis]MBB5131228.1 hypothetical protein [Thermocatellispora tengchongensis]
MATSDPVRRVVAYLGSTKNIAGCALALLGLGAHFLGLAGSLWPVVVAGLYGVGALLAPPERVRLTVSVSAETEAEARRLAADLDALLARAARVHRFPADVLERLEALGEVLRGVLARAEVLTSSPDHLHIVSQTIRDYLPASLEAYANLPRTYALTRREAARRSAHEELLAQLDLLDGKIREVEEAVHRGDEQALRDQGRFLRDRFGRSSLDL